ncbi:DUF6440 family protein [Clostridium scatologenes]|uniref:DUF6440 domain-containing protein n=1 Tax=Clostridium scatologenes TaxID=1548 RepID=A0A0E3JLV6_CLOSL|nr:DUF6440 family protein [Clostridium scatologenes]AKA67273.1 hypothetical protein CSCA_0148 [Clostridium scatologenes]
MLEDEKNKRFEVVYSEGNLEGNKIIRDKQTGVNYLFSFAGYAGGLTVLLDENGKPVITKCNK